MWKFEQYIQTDVDFITDYNQMFNMHTFVTRQVGNPDPAKHAVTHL